MTDPYYIGTEDIHFIPLGSPIASPLIAVGDNRIYRTTWSRCALQCDVGPYIDMRWRAPLPHRPISTDEFWWSCRLYQGGSSIINTTGVVSFLGAFDGDTSWRLMLVAQAGRTPKLYRQVDAAAALPNPGGLYSAYNTDAWTYVATGTGPMPSGGQNAKIDIYVNLTDGIFRLYADLQKILDYTGDLTSEEYDTITGFDLMGSFGATYFSEVYWHPEDTRKLDGIYSIWPIADGNATDWTGDYGDVDERVLDFTDANFTSTPDLIQQYKVRSLLSLTPNVRVASVMLGAEMSTGPTDEALNIRTGGNDYFSVSFDTDGVPDRKMEIWGSNPDTMVDWTQDELRAPDFNVGVKST